MVSSGFLVRVEQLPLVWSDVPGSFARLGFTSRYPALVRDCVELNGAGFPVETRQRLLQLARELEQDAEIPLPSAIGVELGTTSEEWENLLAGKGYRWHNAPWFLAGMYMFHLILLITGYYTTGVDPFHASKVAELEQETPWRLLQTAVGLSAQEEAGSRNRRDQLKRFMKLCLWGNKADGCYKEVKDTVSGDDASLTFADELLLVDHSDKVISFLEKAVESGDVNSVGVQYINDNSGTELLLDLALADHLLGHGWCGKVTMNVKMEPMYVSDAVGPDVNEHIAEMQCTTRTPEAQALGKRLAEYVNRGQLVVRPDIFWNRYAFYWEMPIELQTRLKEEATLVIIKGDLNYRRLLGDRMWPPSSPIEEVVPYFPTAFVSFRTMKSNLVAGIPANIVEKLEKGDPKWRFNGKRAIIQGVVTSAAS
ncbi:Hairy/enhancer-of-split with YRPW motif protein 2 [Phytophthora ramorum]